MNHDPQNNIKIRQRRGGREQLGARRGTGSDGVTTYLIVCLIACQPGLARRECCGFGSGVRLPGAKALLVRDCFVRSETSDTQLHCDKAGGRA